MGAGNQAPVPLVISTQGNAGGNLFANAWRQYGEPVWNQYRGVAVGAAIGGVEGFELELPPR